MKTLRKKLFLSILAVAFAVVSLATSTFAWFSMNKTVTATGMQVTAKSDSTFLLIGNVNNIGTIQTANSITTPLTVTEEDARVYPVAHDTVTNTETATATNVSNLKQYALKTNTEEKISIDAYNALSAAEKELYQEENADGTNWYYQIADAVTASTSTKAKTYLATVDAAYVIHKTCYVTLAKGSNPASNLKVSSMSIASNSTYQDNPDSDEVDATFQAVKVLITTSTAQVELSSSTLSSATVLASTVTDSALVQVDIFIYYDGNDASVYTNNVKNLDGASVSLTFSVD